MSGDHDHPELDDLEARLDGLSDDIGMSPTYGDVHGYIRDLSQGIRLLVNRVLVGEGPIGVNDSELVEYMTTLDKLDAAVKEEG